MGNYPWIKGGNTLKAAGLMALATLWGTMNPLACAVVTAAMPLVSAMAGPLSGGVIPLAGAVLPAVMLAAHGAPAGLLAGMLGYGLMTVAPTLWAFAVQRDFWKALFTQWAAMMGAACCLVLGLRSWVGANVFTGCAQMAVDYILAHPDSDRLLLQLAQAGLAGVTKEMAAQQNLTSQFTALFSNRVVLLPQVRTELAATILTTLESLLYLKGPEGLVTFVAGGGLAGLCVPIGWMRRRGQDTIAMPAFTTWHLPRGMGRGSLMLLMGFMLRYLGPGMVEVYLGIMLVSVFQWIYMIQGAALWEYMQKKQGWSQSARRGFVAVAGLLFPIVLVMMGLVDQVKDGRGLRRIDDNQEEDIEP